MLTERIVARFVVSHRLAGRRDSARVASQESHETSRRKLRAFADVVADRPATPSARGIMIIDADPREILAKHREAPPDVLIEPEVCRRPARFRPSAAAVPSRRKHPAWEPPSRSLCAPLAAPPPTPKS